MSDSCFSIDKIFGILLQVFLVTAFLTIFFFTYTSRVEEDIFNNQIKYVVTDFLTAFPSKVNVTVPITPSDDPEEKSVIDRKNNEIMNKSINMLIIFGVIIVGTIVAMKVLGAKLTWMTVGLSLVLLVAVAITELIFLNVVPKNYILVDPNHIKNIFASSLSGFASSKM